LRVAIVFWAAWGLGGLAAVDAGEPFRATTQQRFQDAERWSRVFDDPARDSWQKPQFVVQALGLEPGMRVADVGSGTGYFCAHLARAVGPEGAVFAVEIEPELVAHLRERAEREGTANVIPVLASRDRPRLPVRGVDRVLLVDTYHHIDGRLEYFRDLARVLAPGGRIAIVDWKKEPLPVGPEPDHKIAREEVIQEMQAAGYRLVAEPDGLPYQYFLLFEPRAADPAEPRRAPGRG
jgi:predicted methyltransferase